MQHVRLLEEEVYQPRKKQHRHATAMASGVLLLHCTSKQKVVQVRFLGERCASYASEFSDLRLKKDTLSAQGGSRGSWPCRGSVPGEFLGIHEVSQFQSSP